MDKMAVKVIEAIWAIQKRLPNVLDYIKPNFAVMALFMAIHLTVLAVVMVAVTIRWAILGIVEATQNQLAHRVQI